jgi:hypothetical protein
LLADVSKALAESDVVAQRKPRLTTTGKIVDVMI